MNQQLSSRPRSHHHVRVSLFCQSFVEPCCVAKLNLYAKAYIHKNAQYTCMHILARCTSLPTCTIFIALITVSFHVPCTAPVSQPTPMKSEPHPMAKQPPTGSPHHQRKYCTLVGIHIQFYWPLFVHRVTSCSDNIAHIQKQDAQWDLPTNGIWYSVLI